jgi:hypothetical protein
LKLVLLFETKTEASALSFFVAEAQAAEFWRVSNLDYGTGIAD